MSTFTVQSRSALVATAARPGIVASGGPSSHGQASTWTGMLTPGTGSAGVILVQSTAPWGVGSPAATP
jgi:hypothetical protein